jgi:hypothetical protein
VGRFELRAKVRTILSNPVQEVDWRVMKNVNVAVCQGWRKAEEGVRERRAQEPRKQRRVAAEELLKSSL